MAAVRYQGQVRARDGLGDLRGVLRGRLAVVDTGHHERRAGDHWELWARVGAAHDGLLLPYEAGRPTSAAISATARRSCGSPWRAGGSPQADQDVDQIIEPAGLGEGNVPVPAAGLLLGVGARRGAEQHQPYYPI